MSKRIALIVGIDQYNCEEIVDLQGAIRDASNFKAYLEYGLPEGERFETKFLSNPSHERVIEALENIRLELQDEEDVVFVLYFSGHGKRFHDGASQLLLCRDATRMTLLGRNTGGAITPEDLAYYKDEIPGHKFFCFDSCRSQLDRAHGDDLDENGTSLFRDVVCQRSKAAQAKFYCHWSLSSCADRERASDDGAFMKAMLDTMNTSVAAHGRILLDDSFVKAIADRLHKVNPDSYQHPVGGGNPFCLCGTEDSAGVTAISDEDFRTCAEELAQDSEKKVGEEQDANAKAKHNADRRVVKIKMEDAKTLAGQGRYAEAIGKIDDALGIMPDGEVGALLRKTRGNYVKAGKALEEKAEEEKRAKELEAERARREAERARTKVINDSELVEEPARTAGALKTLTLKGIEWRFRWCPAGTFMMGSSKLGLWVLSNEKLHHVTLTRGFWMQETTVTQEMWTSFMGANPSYNAKGGKYPVEKVSWNDVQGFIRTLNSNSGYRFRLATEAEWEYACRAGQNYRYSGSDDLDRVGWYDGNSGGHTHEVGQKQANGWGLYDMSGNVYEWVQDWYGGYPSGTATDPQGPSGGSDRVLRGGSWSRGASSCRCAYRGGIDPGSSWNFVGFRLLLESVE